MVSKQSFTKYFALSYCLFAVALNQDINEKMVLVSEVRPEVPSSCQNQWGCPWLCRQQAVYLDRNILYVARSHFVDEEMGTHRSHSKLPSSPWGLCRLLGLHDSPEIVVTYPFPLDMDRQPLALFGDFVPLSRRSPYPPPGGALARQGPERVCREILALHKRPFCMTLVNVKAVYGSGNLFKKNLWNYVL